MQKFSWHNHDNFFIHIIQISKSAYSLSLVCCKVWASLPELSLDRTTSCSNSVLMFAICMICMTLSALFVCIGNFLALSNEFQEYSTLVNVLNLIVAILIPWLWDAVILFNVTFAMLFALIQKMEEKLNTLPTEAWIIDTILLYNKFQRSINLPAFLIPSLTWGNQKYLCLW